MTDNEVLELQRRLNLHYKLADLESATSLQGYLDRVVINSAPEPRRFLDIREPWQSQVFAELDMSLAQVAGFTTPRPGTNSHWFTLPRGHDKTSAIARRLNWLLAYGKKHLTILTAAGDSDQATLILDAMRTEAALNPWLSRRVRFTRSRAFGQGGSLLVLTADALTSFGYNPDVVILDEITHWKKRDLWDVLISGRAKRRGSVFAVITNAGVRGSWQDQVFQALRSDSSWAVFQSPPHVQLAGWMDSQATESIRKFLPSGLARRVLDNVWIDAGEESGFLTRGDVKECEDAGRRFGILPTKRGRHDVDYVVGIDYGPKRDRTALSVVHHAHGGWIQVDRLDVWQGSPDSPVQISRVESWIDQVNKDFHRPRLIIDPYQMEGTVQRYEYHQNIDRFEPRGGKSNYEMASTLRSLVVNHNLVWYPTAGDLVVESNGTTRTETFSDELCSLILKPMTYGYRFDHVPPGSPIPKTGTAVVVHDDRAVAVGMAALYAARNPPAPPWVPPPPITNKPKHTLPDLDMRSTPGRGLWGT